MDKDCKRSGNFTPFEKDIVLESDRISFSVPKMIIFDGFGYFRFQPKMTAFSFLVTFSVEIRKKTPKLITFKQAEAAIVD